MRLMVQAHLRTSTLLPAHSQRLFGRNYSFEVTDQSGETKLLLDADRHGAILRYINSKEPTNCETHSEANHEYD